MTSIKKPPTCSLGYWWLLQGCIGCIPICYAKNIFVGQMPNVHRKNVALLGGWIPNVSWKKNIAIDPHEMVARSAISWWSSLHSMLAAPERPEAASGSAWGSERSAPRPGSPQWRMAEPSKRCVFSHQTCELHQKIWGGIRLDTLKTRVYPFFCGD